MKPEGGCTPDQSFDCEESRIRAFASAKAVGDKVQVVDELMQMLARQLAHVAVAQSTGAPDRTTTPSESSPGKSTQPM